LRPFVLDGPASVDKNAWRGGEHKLASYGRALHESVGWGKMKAVQAVSMRLDVLDQVGRPNVPTDLSLFLADRGR